MGTSLKRNDKIIKDIPMIMDKHNKPQLNQD